MKGIKSLLKKDNNNVNGLVMFYENRNIMFFKVLGSFIYSTINKYICLDCFCIQQDTLSSNDRSFHDTTFDNLSVIGIPWLLMNIMSCRGFVKE